MLVLVAALLLTLQRYDLCFRRLPNSLVGLYAVLCPVALWCSGTLPAVWLQHGIVALVAFLVLLAMFAAGGMGGGDVKLGTAVLAWAGMKSLAVSLVVIAVVGLLMALLGVLADWLARHGKGGCAGKARGRWQKVLHALSARRGVPYGVALAAGGMAALPAYW